MKLSHLGPRVPAVVKWGYGLDGPLLSGTRQGFEDSYLPDRSNPAVGVSQAQRLTKDTSDFKLLSVEFL